jgi:phospholipid/cholesterol/gamma-HCH transport system substrate-binding protein
MEEKYARAKLGFMVVVALTIVIFAIMWGKNISLTKKYYHATIFFPDVTGLEKGASVLVNGILEGKVINFILKNEGVIVEVMIHHDVKLNSDAYAYIEAPDLMAERVVSIIPGHSGIDFPKGENIPGEPSYSFSRIFSSVNDVGDNLNKTLIEIKSTTISLRNIMEDPALLNNLDRAMNDLTSATASLREIIASSQPQIDSSLNNINSASRKVSDLVNKHSGSLDSTLSQLTEISRQLRKLSIDAQEYSQTLRNQEGTLGKLLYQDDLYQKLNQTTADLDSLINEIRKKGVKAHLKIF